MEWNCTNELPVRAFADIVKNSSNGTADTTINKKIPHQNHLWRKKSLAKREGFGRVLN